MWQSASHCQGIAEAIVICQNEALCGSLLVTTNLELQQAICQSLSVHNKSPYSGVQELHMAVSRGWLWDRPEKYPCAESSEAELECRLGRALADMDWYGGAWSRGSVAVMCGSSGSFLMSNVESVVMLLPARCALEPRSDDSSGCKLETALQETEIINLKFLYLAVVLEGVCHLLCFQ